MPTPKGWHPKGWAGGWGVRAFGGRQGEGYRVGGWGVYADAKKCREGACPPRSISPPDADANNFSAVVLYGLLL